MADPERSVQETVEEAFANIGPGSTVLSIHQHFHVGEDGVGPKKPIGNYGDSEFDQTAEAEKLKETKMERAANARRMEAMQSGFKGPWISPRGMLVITLSALALAGLGVKSCSANAQTSIPDAVAQIQPN